MKLSIIIPAFNEQNTIATVLDAVEKSPVSVDKEIIVINDGSTDQTRSILEKYKNNYKIINLDKNSGKGAAIRRGLKEATGDIAIIQDSDLEYNPCDYSTLLAPINEGYADVVYGSRFVTVHPRRVLYFGHYLANKFVTFLSNIFTGLNLSDMETCYKVLNRKAIDIITPKLVSNRFGIEPEITAHVAKNKLRVYEVGISYRGRTYAEGKKINWKDGLAAIWHIVRFNIFTK